MVCPLLLSKNSWKSFVTIASHSSYFTDMSSKEVYCHDEWWAKCIWMDVLDSHVRSENAYNVHTISVYGHSYIRFCPSLFMTEHVSNCPKCSNDVSRDHGHQHVHYTFKYKQGSTVPSDKSHLQNVHELGLLCHMNLQTDINVLACCNVVMPRQEWKTGSGPETHQHRCGKLTWHKQLCRYDVLQRQDIIF